MVEMKDVLNAANTDLGWGAITGTSFALAYLSICTGKWLFGKGVGASSRFIDDLIANTKSRATVASLLLLTGPAILSGSITGINGYGLEHIVLSGGIGLGISMCVLGLAFFLSLIP